MRRRGARDEGGFVALELVLGVAVLLFPASMLVVTLPRWSERQSTGRAIAREVARDSAVAGICDLDRARTIARVMSENLGVATADVSVQLDCWPGAPLARNTAVTASVTVAMPAVAIPGVADVGAWSWTARHREPVDPYRSIP